MKKRILSMVLVLCMVVGMLPTTAWGFDLSAFSVFETEIETQVITPEQLGGSSQENSDEISSENYETSTLSTILVGAGTPESPFLIRDQPDFEQFATHVNSDDQLQGSSTYYYEAHYQLSGNLSLTSNIMDNLIIGTNGEGFCGTFDGNGYTITSNGISQSNAKTKVALFATVSEGAVIKNLTYESGTIVMAYSESSSSDFYVAGLVAVNNGTIMNCTNKVNVSALVSARYLGSGTDPVASTTAGGVGTTLTTPTNNVSSGLTSSNYDVKVTNISNANYYNYSPGAPTISTSVVSVATLDSRTILSGKIYVGGVVGHNQSKGVIVNCENTGSVTGSMTNQTTAASNVYAGGIAGKNEGKIYNSSNTGAVSATAGNLTYHVTSTHTWNYTDYYTVTGTVNSTGIDAGVASGTTVSRPGVYDKYTANYFGWTFSSNSPTATAGGIVGIDNGSLIINSYNQGAINSNAETFTNNFKNETITANSNAGGLAGETSSSTKIINSYNTGAVSAISSNLGTTTAVKEVDSSATAANPSVTESSTDSTRDGTPTYPAATTILIDGTAQDKINYAYSSAGGFIGKGVSGTTLTNGYTSGAIVASAIGSYSGIYTSTSYPSKDYAGGVSGQGTAGTNAFWLEGMGANGQIGTGTNATNSYSSGGTVEGNSYKMKPLLQKWVTTEANESAYTSYFSDPIYDGVYEGYNDLTFLGLSQWVSSETEPSFAHRIDTKQMLITDTKSEVDSCTIEVTRVGDGESIEDNHSYGDYYPDTQKGDTIEVQITPFKEIDGITSKYKVEKVTLENLYTGETTVLEEDANILDLYTFEMPDASVVIWVETSALNGAGCGGGTGVAYDYEYRDYVGTSGSYYLLGNIETNLSKTFTGDTTICLNGFNLTYTGNGYPFTLADGATLTLCGCNKSGSNLISTNGSAVTGSGNVVMRYGTASSITNKLNVTTGKESIALTTGSITISGANLTNTGTGTTVYTETGDITISDSATIKGGATGVKVENGNLKITTSTITGTSTVAVAMSNGNANATLTGAIISGNTGNGINLYGGNLTINGATTITENKIGIVQGGGTLSIEGTTSITANTDAGVNVTDSNASITVSGTPTITGNGTTHGADYTERDGVYLSKGSILNVGILTVADTIKPDIFVAGHADNDNKVAQAASTNSNFKTYADTYAGTDGTGYINGATTSFYRTAYDAIYLTKVTPVPADWELKFDGTNDSLQNLTTQTTTGEDPYELVWTYNTLSLKEYFESTTGSGGDGTGNIQFTLTDEPSATATKTIVYKKLADDGITYETLAAGTTPENAGSYQIWIKVNGGDIFDNTEVLVANLTIKPVTLSPSNYTLTIGGVEYVGKAIYEAIYNGLAQEPSVEITVNANILIPGGSPAKPLTEDVDFEIVKYTDNIDWGTNAKVHLKGLGNYQFEHSHSFEIDNADTDLELWNKAELTGQSFIYGNEIKVQVRPVSEGNPVTLDDHSNYDVILYVAYEDGSIEKLASAYTYFETAYDPNTSDFDSVNSVYTLTYANTDKKLEIGKNSLFVEFTPKTTLNGSTNAGNMGFGIVKFDLDLEPRQLLAKLDTTNSNLIREYDGTNRFTVNLSLNESSNADNNPLPLDKEYVSAVAYGFVESANIGSYQLYVDDVKLSGGTSGDHSDYYSLTIENVNVADYVKIVAANLNDLNISKNQTITVMKGVGTYTTPEFTYTVDGVEVAVPGGVTYTDEVYNSYDNIVAYLKTLDVNGVLTVGYSFAVDPTVAGNYTADSFTGKLTFIVVDIKFEGIENAIVVKDEAIYGDVNNFFYDPSKFVANIGTTTTTGAYFLTVTDSLGGKVTDLSLMKVGNYSYSVSFTSYDGAYIDSFVTEGTFTIIPRPVTLEWNSLSFEYDSTEITPKASITNLVWVDDVSVEVTGGQINVGDYTGVLTLVGDDKANYVLSQETITFKIVPAEAKGLITVSHQDTDGSTALSAGDILTADISSVTPLGGTVFYHWYRDDILMTSAVWPTYTVSTADAVGTTLRCEVTFSGNTTGTISTVGMDVGDFYFTGSVTISHLDGVLTATVVDTNTDDYTILWSGVANSGNGETYTLDLSDYGNTVTVTVIANHGSGFCGNFNTSTSVAAVKPYTPELTVEPGDTCVNVSWTEPFHGGSALESYTLTVTDREGNDIYNSPFTFDTTENSYTVMNLVNNNVYTFTISVKNAVGVTYSESLTAVPRADADVEVEGEITTSTTTEEYEDEDGNIITTTVVTEINSADGSVRVTTTVETLSPNGDKTVVTTMTFTDGTGTLVESSESFSANSGDPLINYEISSDEDGSESLLTATTESTDVITLPVSLLQPIVDTDDSTITFVTPNATISFDNDALDSIFTLANPYSDDVLELIAEYTAPDKMPMSIRERLSDAFIMDLTLKLGNVTVTDFEPGHVTITLPYTKYDTSKNVSVYHVSDSGSMTRMDNAVYDADSKTVTFTATHFSYYAVLEEANRFTDVYVSDYYYDAVQWGVENGITNGSTPTTFNPHAKCTRAEAITMLWKAMGSEQSSAYMPFTDVTASDYYFDSFRWAYGAGISTGTKPTLAGPFDVCTRDQIVTFLWIANGKTVVDEELYFSDVPVGGWYTEAIRWAVSEDVTAGSSPTTFSPDNVCTRAEIITFLYKCSTL